MNLPRLVLLGIALSVALSAPAAAQGGAGAEELVRVGHESYDLGDYEGARVRAEQALASLERSRQAGDLRAVPAMLLLGAAAGRLGDEDAARDAFARALELDPEASLDPALATAELVALLEAARARSGPPACSEVEGIHHERVSAAEEGKGIELRCRVAPGLVQSRMVAYYRSDIGGDDFASVALERRGECDCAGEIPADAVVGPRVHYYLAALTGDGRVAATLGRADAPFAIPVQARAAPAPERPAAATRDEDELARALRGPPPQKRGCAGCGAGAGAGAGAGTLGLLVVAGLAAISRRRRVLG